MLRPESHRSAASHCKLDKLEHKLSISAGGTTVVRTNQGPRRSFGRDMFAAGMAGGLAAGEWGGRLIVSSIVGLAS